MEFWVCAFSVLLFGTSFALSELIKNETLAEQWVWEFNSRAEDEFYETSVASWAFFTNLTDHNSALSIEAGVKAAAFLKEAYQNASKYDWRNFKDANLKRLFSHITDIGSAVLPEEKITKLETVGTDLEGMYSKGKACSKPEDSDPNKCYPLDPDLTKLLATNRQWDTLVWAWKTWRDVTGKLMKDKYEEFIYLQNEAAKSNQYADQGAYWRSWYEIDNLEAECDRLWNTVKPLYQNLHAYVKRKLKAKYQGKAFPSTGHIPAHILGNMWSQTWENIFNEVEPYQGKARVDVTQALENQGYNATSMMRLSEEFFTSLGLEPMPDSFWEKSLLVKPDDREVVCHASAWDFSKYGDVRIKQCTEMTMPWLITTHHEMGHIAYYLEYMDQHISFRGGANPGFHEAVGDVLALSVSTPEHLHEIGLLAQVENDTEADINYLMSMALDKISFLPFGFLMDQWRWSVFRGDTTKDNYNRKWWDLRCKYQGIAPPVQRSEEDFDPGAKYHIPGNTPYVRYFVSFIIQFQFHKALCEAAGNTRPLHRCDIYRSAAAGLKLKNMLKLGTSKPWQDAMQQIAGTRSMDASALVEYFKPLNDWLTEQNKGHNDVTWTEECPPDSFKPETGAASKIFASAGLILTLFIYMIF